MAAMTFDAKRLLELAKQAVANKDAAVAEWEQIQKDYKADHQLNWHTDEKQAQIKAARDYLTKCLSRGVTPTTEGVRRAAGAYMSDLQYSPPSDWQMTRDLEKLKPKGLSIQTTDFRALIAVLESSGIDRVSPNQLAIMGFKSEALQRLFRESLTS